MALRQELRIESVRHASGGCVHRCHAVVIGGKRRFLKTNSQDRQDLFAAEAQGLLALRNGGLRAPQPLSHGLAGGEAYLLL